MTLLRGLSAFPRLLVATTVANLTAVAPAFAAPTFSLPFDVTSFGTREWLLYGSVALLVIGLVAKMIDNHTHKDPTPQGPDLRWWKNPPPNLQS